MSEVSFGPAAGAAPAPVITPVNPATTTVVTPTQSPTPEVAVTPYQKPGALAPSGGLGLNDFLPELKDIILPRLNIVQGIGKLMETFPQGAIIFGQNLVLFEPPIRRQDGSNVKEGTPPVNITVLGFRPTRFVEKVEGGARGMIVNTEDEVIKAGGTLDYQEWQLKKAAGIRKFEPLAEAMVAIRRPDHIKDDDTTFVYEADGQKYALALWGLKGVSYTEGAKKVFFTARQIGALRGGYYTHSYSLTTILKQYQGGNKAWVPVCISPVKNSEKFLEFVKGILGS